MKDGIVDKSSAVLLIGGGDCPETLLKQALDEADCVVAADGGAARALDLGRIPDLVIGDMDSLAPALRARIPPERLIEVTEQDSTDFDKALRRITAPLVLAHGFLGARVDHQLAAMTVLVQRPEQRCILVGAQDVVALCPPRLALDLAPDTRVSLYPMGRVTGRSEGLRWPIAGIGFAPDGTIGTSNAALGPVTLEMDAAAMLVILPVACLPALRAGLAAPSAPWPARAG